MLLLHFSFAEMLTIQNWNFAFSVTIIAWIYHQLPPPGGNKHHILQHQTWSPQSLRLCKCSSTFCSTKSTNHPCLGSVTSLSLNTLQNIANAFNGTYWVLWRACYFESKKRFIAHHARGWWISAWSYVDKYIHNQMSMTIWYVNLWKCFTVPSTLSILTRWVCQTYLDWWKF